MRKLTTFILNEESNEKNEKKKRQNATEALHTEVLLLPECGLEIVCCRRISLCSNRAPYIVDNRDNAALCTEAGSRDCHLTWSFK